MRTTAIVWVLALAACGGSTAKKTGNDAPIDVSSGGSADAPTDSRLIDSPNVILIDAPPDSSGGVCNVLTQTGCTASEKCTWIIDQADVNASIGHIGCAPNGVQATGASCTRNPPGATGYDDCVRGDYCFGPGLGGAGVCRVICDNAGGSPACTAGFACTTYDGVFGPSGQPVAAGGCDPTCDPLAG